MFKLKIRAIGRLTDSWQREAVDIYLTRLKPYASILLTELPEGHGGSTKPDSLKTAKNEAESLLRGISPDAFVVALDETGTQYDSRTFAQQLQTWGQNGREIVFILGGSWGLSADVRTRAHIILSFGKATLPHGLARIVLCEQLYRSAMIASGKTYHK